MPTTQLRQPSPIVRDSRAASCSSVGFDGYTSRSTVASSTGASHNRARNPDLSRVLPSSEELWKRAFDTQAAIDYRALTDLSVNQWRWKASNNRFALFQRQVEQQQCDASKKRAHEVLSAGEIRCSTAELINILRPGNEREHNSVMQALYRKDYIYGSSVQVVPPSASAAATSDIEGSDAAASDEQLAVKTSTFVRTNILSKHEQWCYLEHFKRKSATDPSAGFTVTIASMNEDELRTGKAMDRERVNDMHGVVAGYLVEKVPNENLMRVLFYAQYTDVNGSAKGKVSSRTMRARLAFFAKGATRLPEVVRRRRLGAQTFANRKAFVAKNARCVCCTKSLHVFSKKKRCYLCGYFVCDKDWSIQNVETRSGDVTAARVCSRCMEAVEYCDYSLVSPGELGAPRILPTPEGLPSPSATMATFLRGALEAAGSESKKRSVKSVIKHLVGQEEAKAHRAGSSSFSLTDASHEQEYHAALDAYLKVESLPLEQCVLANAVVRNYGISVSENPAAPDAQAPAYPAAENEAVRLSAIERGCIDQIGNADEFNIIASLAARELECYASLITVITGSEQLVLGANLEDLQKIELPRTHAFCSHTILDDKPLVVPHPEADVRFSNYVPVKQLGARFYCGFPIVARDNTVVGSVCCLDMKSHELTQAQYATMTRLAATASRVMQLKGQEIESRSRAGTAATTAVAPTVYKQL